MSHTVRHTVRIMLYVTNVSNAAPKVRQEGISASPLLRQLTHLRLLLIALIAVPCVSFRL